MRLNNLSGTRLSFMLIFIKFELPYNLIINPLTARSTQVSPFTEISILFKEEIIKKISYERRAYESVDEKSLS